MAATESEKYMCGSLPCKLTLILIETPFSAFVNGADPDQAALVRAV